MGYFPFFIDISDRRILVVGGGNVALRKVEKLLPFGADITVVAPKICKRLSQMNGISVQKRKFLDSDLDGVFTVIAATDDRSLNSRIHALCEERGILVNAVDDPENCGFVFPAIVQEEGITIGISTGGRAPAFSKFIRRQVERLLDGYTLELGDMLARARPMIHEMFPTPELRARASDDLISCVIGDDLPNDEELAAILGNIRSDYENED